MLEYKLEQDLSVVVNKTQRVYEFEYTSYSPGSIGVCVLDTGTNYIDTSKSFLHFEFVTASHGGNTYTFGIHGSGCNVINRVIVFARDGTELSRTENVNLLNHIMLPLTYDREWFKRQGAMMWHGSHIFPGSLTTIIPMYILSPLFAYGRLLPAQLVSGMRIEITFEETNKVSFGAINDATLTGLGPSPSAIAYTIADAEFIVETVKLGDSTRLAMDDICATRGLEIVHTAWHHTYLDHQTDMSTGVTVDVHGSFARALRAFARVRPTGGTTTANTPQPDHKRDSFRGEDLFPISKYQWRLGNRYYPEKMVGLPNGGRVFLISYSHLLNAIGQFGGNNSSYLPALYDNSMFDIVGDIMLGDFTAGLGPSRNGFYAAFPGQPGSYVRDGHVIGVSFVRDGEYPLSGRPISNSDPLSLFIKGTSTSLEIAATPGNDLTTVTSPPNRRVDVFVEYVKLIRVFTNNIEVEQ